MKSKREQKALVLLLCFWLVGAPAAFGQPSTDLRSVFQAPTQERDWQVLARRYSGRGEIGLLGVRWRARDRVCQTLNLARGYEHWSGREGAWRNAVSSACMSVAQAIVDAVGSGLLAGADRPRDRTAPSLALFRLSMQSHTWIARLSSSRTCDARGENCVTREALPQDRVLQELYRQVDESLLSR